MKSTSKKFFDVSIAGHQTKGDPATLAWNKNQKLLQGLGDNTLNCLCVPQAPPQLSVRRKNNHYFPARWPNTNLLHHPGCHYYSSYQKKNLNDDTKPAVSELDDGGLRVHLLTSLKVAGAQQKIVVANDPVTRTGVQKRQERAKDRHVFNLLWEQAGLTSFSGAKAQKLTWFLIAQRLMHAAGEIVISKSGEKLSDYLLIAGPNSSRNLQEHNSRVLALPERRYFIVGRLKSVTVRDDQGKPNALLPLRDAIDGIKLNVSRKKFNKYARRWPLLEKATDMSGHVLVFACITPKKTFATGTDRWFEVTQLCLLPVSGHYIPVESSYELTFAEYLIKEKRDFGKPIASQNNGAVRPDFVLYDTAPVTFVEVWGMDTPDYRERREEKVKYYTDNRLSLLEWDAQANMSLPNLPHNVKQHPEG